MICVHAVRELPAERDLAAWVAGERARGARPWWLDSALRHPRLGRFSFAGSGALGVVRSFGQRSVVDIRRSAWTGLAPGRHERHGDPLSALRALLPPRPGGDDPPFPFAGGLVGSFGYELAETLLGVPLRAERDPGLPDLSFLLVDTQLAVDHEEGRTFACALGAGRDAHGAAGDAALRLDALEQSWLDTPQHGDAPGQRDGAGLDDGAGLPVRRSLERSAYLAAAQRLLEWIREGEVYQANLTHRLELTAAGDPFGLYRELRAVNPAPFAAYLELPDVTLIGSSPERFLSVDAAGRVETRPIKGTRPRHPDPAVDATLAEALIHSEKDRAENLMIVDLMRNDLGRVCEIGSIEVPELFALESYASVHQLVSSVCGRLRDEHDALDLVRAAFPPGSMTGAPKRAAVCLIDRLEPVARGLYAGAVGYLDARGGADLSVVIRSIVQREDRAFVQVGGGIVADSQPEAELAESMDKARALLAALARAAKAGAAGSVKPT